MSEKMGIFHSLHYNHTTFYLKWEYNSLFSLTFSLSSLALLVEVVLSLQTEKKNYDEYSVLRAYPASQEDLDLLHSIGNPS